MADNRRKNTAADGKRPLAASGATDDEAVKRCDVCHGPLKPPVYQLGASGRPQCSSPRRVACSDCGAGQRRSFADLAEEAVDVVSRHLGYFRVPCPYQEYGCAIPVVSRDAAAHVVACAHAPCACPECAFPGSPAQLVRHFTDPAGPHRWTATEIAYGEVLPFAVNMLEEPRQDKRLLVAEEDRGVFLLALALGVGDPCSGRAAVVCVRANADAAGPVYGCSLVVDCLPRALRVSETSVVPSCSTPGEFDVDAPCVSACQFSLQSEETKELRLRVRVHLQNQGYQGIPVRIRLPVSQI